ncbi:MAG: ribosome biogenesis GTP-binding protein YihA/YsxC [Candidatus Binataceae bacterium]
MTKKKLDVRFVASAFALDQCPKWARAEVAFAGRSNVGKSSILNALAGVKGLARISKTPGRTRGLNFFASGDSLALVDLPGYGYAAMSHAEAAKIADFLDAYIKQRENLAALVMLIDARRGPGPGEFELADIVRRRPIKLIVVATKSDKLRAAERAAAPKLFDRLGQRPLLCSARDNEGIDALRRLVTISAA